MQKINPIKLWEWILRRPKPKQAAGKPLHLLKESFNHNEWEELTLDWVNRSQYDSMKKALKCAFFHFKTGTNSFNDPIQYLDKDNSKGFAVLLSKVCDDYNLTDYRCLQHLIAQQLVDHRYVVKLTDIRSTHIAGQLQKTYRYYHKPSYKIQLTKPINQLFGNITTELILRDDEPYLFRVMAHKYSDRNYADAAGLDDMMEVILR